MKAVSMATLQLSLSSFPPAHVEALTTRVEEAYRHYAPVIQEMVLSHASLTKDLEDGINGPSALKHLRQQASILGHLESLGLLCPGTCVAEFGAGRGRLSHCIANVLGSSGRVYYVLIDRANCRRKMDVLYRKEHGDRYRRLLIDIEHLDLGKLDLFQGGKVERIVGVSKHLCGCATDLTLRCLLETLPSGRGSRPTTADGRLDAHTFPQGHPTTDGRLGAHTLPAVSGILIALCCHHRCSWANFVGRDHFARMGFTPADFHMICHMTSWAVCGQRPSKRADGDSSEATRLGKAQKTSCESTVASGKKEHADMLDSDGAGIRNHDSNDQSCTGGEIPHEGVELFGGYVPHPKESIGLKCKRLIDAARLMYLAEHGLNARLVRFVDKSTSLENILLVATPV